MINLNDIGSILAMVTFMLGFLWLFSERIPFLSVLVLLMLTVGAFLCARIDEK
jgi:hypothetical protein